MLLRRRVHLLSCRARVGIEASNGGPGSLHPLFSLLMRCLKCRYRLPALILGRFKIILGRLDCRLLLYQSRLHVHQARTRGITFGLSSIYNHNRISSCGINNSSRSNAFISNRLIFFVLRFSIQLLSLLFVLFNNLNYLFSFFPRISG